MTDSRHTPDDALLQHYRQHSTGEPPASLDAFILNALANGIRHRRRVGTDDRRGHALPGAAT